jgi:hypothetical protein
MEGEIVLKNNIFSGSVKELSETTESIYDNIFKKYVNDLDYVGNNVENLIMKIKNNENLSASTKCMHFSALLWKSKNPLYKKEIAELRKVTSQEYKDGKKPAKIDWLNLSEKSKLIKKQWDIYKTIPVEKWSLKIFLLAQATLLSHLYFDIPARRSEYVTVQFTDDTKNNYYDSFTRTFHFRNYKTSKYHGEQMITVNSTIDDIIQKLRMYSKSDWMFTSSKGKVFTLKDLNVTLRKHFGAGTCMIRRSYISDCYKAVPPLAEMEQRANDMGHTLKTALLCYKKEVTT